MALCHDERDYAMGFSRHNPHAHRRTRHIHADKVRERTSYLKSLTPAQKKAYDRVELCLAAVGQYFVARGSMTPIRLAELHKLFPAFAKTMGYSGPFYRSKDGECRAVSISYPRKRGEFWLLTPYFDYDRLEDEDKKRVETKKAQRAALAFCKAWLPDWDWDKTKLK